MNAEMLLQIADTYFALQMLKDEIEDSQQLKEDLKQLESLYLNAKNGDLDDVQEAKKQAILDKYAAARESAVSRYLNS